MQTRTKLATAWTVAVAVLMLAAALPTHAHAAFAQGAAALPTTAQVEKASSSYLVVEVANHVIDDFVAVLRGTSHSGSSFPKPELDLTYKWCGTFECLCIDIEPDECVPESNQVGGDRLSVASSLRAPAVLDLVARQLASGKYSEVKLCSTFQWLHVGCVIVSPRDE